MPSEHPPSATISLRSPVPGDLGWVVHRQAVLYAAEYGWRGTFEALLAKIVSDFVLNFVDGRELCWIAEQNGVIVGSVFVMQQDEFTARLRMLYVDPAVRGRGLGRQLIDACVSFARLAGYRALVLSTNRLLLAARHLYRESGFRQVPCPEHVRHEHEQAEEPWEPLLQPEDTES